MRRLISVGRHIFVRTVALMGAFAVAGAVITRFGDASIAAHQIAFQLWIFLALVLDAIAIAGQVLVGRALGAGDSERAFAASARMIWLGVYAGSCSAARCSCSSPCCRVSSPATSWCSSALGLSGSSSP